MKYLREKYNEIHNTIDNPSILYVIFWMTMYCSVQFVKGLFILGCFLFAVHFIYGIIVFAGLAIFY